MIFGGLEINRVGTGEIETRQQGAHETQTAKPRHAERDCFSINEEWRAERAPPPDGLKTSHVYVGLRSSAKRKKRKFMWTAFKNVNKGTVPAVSLPRSEEHTSELQSPM